MVVFQNKQRKKPKKNSANQISPGKWRLKWRRFTKDFMFWLKLMKKTANAIISKACRIFKNKFLAYNSKLSKSKLWSSAHWPPRCCDWSRGKSRPAAGFAAWSRCLPAGKTQSQERRGTEQTSLQGHWYNSMHTQQLILIFYVNKMEQKKLQWKHCFSCWSKTSPFIGAWQQTA